VKPKPEGFPPNYIISHSHLETQHMRRHSVATVSHAIPISDKGQSVPAHHDLASTWATYSGELRSPTQKSNDLVRSPSAVPADLAPPELTRNQSRSADTNPKYLLQDHFGSVKESDRERSISMDKDRISRSGRPPQHVCSSLLLSALYFFDLSRSPTSLLIPLWLLLHFPILQLHFILEEGLTLRVREGT
jgi:hypothetical protein